MTINTRLFVTTIIVFLFLFKTNANESNFLENKTLKEIWFEEDIFSDHAFYEAHIQEETFKREKIIDDLKRTKFNLVNGDLNRAKFYLNRIDSKNNKINLVIKYYNALIFFLEENFHKSYEELKDKRLDTNENFKRVCLLKIFNLMAINETSELEALSERCISLNSKHSINEFFWLQLMVKLKLKDFSGIKRIMLTDTNQTINDEEMSKIWLKAGLYLNQEEEILKLISMLPEKSYQSYRLREIVAFMYLRKGTKEDREKALSFIEDIDSVNAQNIKGSIKLLNKEYEISFGHFKLALLKKEDSKNSIERAIPLSFILKQWEDGLKLLNKQSNKIVDPRNIATTKVVFLIKNKEYQKALIEIEGLKSSFQNNPPFEILMMESFVKIMTSKDKDKYHFLKIHDSTEKACKNFDGINCWLSLKLNEYENIITHILNKDNVMNNPSEFINELKSDFKPSPLKENKNIDQKDIEEMDSSIVDQLVNKPKVQN